MTPQRKAGLVVAVALSQVLAVAADPTLGPDGSSAAELSAPSPVGEALALAIVEYREQGEACADPEPPIHVRCRPIPACTWPGSTTWIAE